MCLRSPVREQIVGVLAEPNYVNGVPDHMPDLDALLDAGQRGEILILTSPGRVGVAAATLSRGGFRGERGLHSSNRTKRKKWTWRSGHPNGVQSRDS
jgi:hypothetical protein